MTTDGSIELETVENVRRIFIDDKSSIIIVKGEGVKIEKMFVWLLP